MTDAGEPNSLADAAEPPRKMVCSLPTESPSPLKSPPRLTSNPSDDSTPTAAEQILIEA